MLDQSLFELASATCFSSTLLASSLRRRLLSTDNLNDPQERKLFHRQCLANLRADLDADYPRRFRLNDMEMALGTLWSAHVFFGPSGGKLKMLDGLFDQLFLENGDIIHYRDGQVQAYARNAARLDPAVLVAWRLATRLREQPQLDCDDLLRIVNAQRPFFSPLPQIDRPFAENHVHLGGVHYDGLVLMSGLSESLRELPEAAAKAVLPLQRLAQCLLIEIGDQTPSADDVRKYCAQTLGGGWQIELPMSINWRWLAEKQQNPAIVRHPHWLREQIAHALVRGNTSKAWLWFLIWCWTLYQDPACSCELRMAVFYLLNSLTNLRRQLLMDGQGLTRFAGIYDNSFRRNMGWPRQYTDAARRIFHGDADVAEIKVTHSQFSPDAIVDWLNHLGGATGLTPLTKLLPPPVEQHMALKYAFERWHFCIHLIRNELSRDNPSYVWAEAARLETKLTSQASWDRDELLNTSSMWPGRLQPSRWVRGLDVAGDENLVKTEVFASALRWLRQGLQSRPFGAAATPGLHLSVHAGEDYAHPLSGMRHIDETVVFCAMRSGDRLGHALALGIVPLTWLQRQGEAVLELDEYVDDLVWAWHHACEMSPYLDLAAQIVPKLERTLRRLIPYLSWLPPGQENQSPNVLFDAWHLRRNCYHYVTRYRQGHLNDPKLNVAVPDRQEFDQLSAAARLYLQRWRSLSSEKSGIDPVIFPLEASARKAHYKVRVRLSDQACRGDHHLDEDLTMITVTETPNEVAFMHALQDWLLDRYDHLGLIIEANPTSNVYIARLKNHREHPVFRWYPPDEESLAPGARNNLYGLRRGPIKFCINTDDPGIMPTTLRTEFELLCEAAQELGVSRTQAENWLERIRVFGIEQFNQKHEPLWG